MEINSMKWVIIDLETTGLDPKKDKIIEIGAVLLSDKGERRHFHSLINPEEPLRRVITELTGISDEMLLGQPLLEEILPDLIQFIDDAVPVAHNASFDGSFLEPYLGAGSDEWLDTIVLSKMVFPMLESYSLTNLIEYFDIDTPRHHRALADAEATADLFLLIREALRKTDKGILAAWVSLLSDSHFVYCDFLEEFDPDMFAEAYLPPKPSAAKEGDELSDHDGETEKYIIDRREMRRVFDDEDGLKRFVSGYRPRESQIQMADAVCEAFNNDEYLLAEAGTGTGKTIAYLVPSVLLSLKGGHPVIVSTHTIHLQDQIMRKDIPELNNCFRGAIRSALIKGRNHYLCFRKWEWEYENGDHDDAFFMARILPWVCETEDGDGDVLNLNKYEKRTWQRFSASSENCLGVRCPYYHSRCFVRRARKEGERAHLIIINHSLLLTDSVMGGGILPNSGYLIIDEAHQLETVAENSLGGSFSFYDHVGMISELTSILQKLLRRVSLPDLYAKEESLDKTREKQDFLSDLMDELRENGEKGKECFSAIKELLDYCAKYEQMTFRTLRISEKIRSRAFWSDTETAIENLRLWYEDILNQLSRTAALFDAELEEDGNEKEKIRFAVIRSALTENAAILTSFLGGEEENTVAWLEEGNERALYPILKTAPLRIDQALAKTLYSHKESVVFVSATLSVNRNFKYYRETCGIDLAEKKVSELLLPSPFDYKKHAALLAATDVPLVGTVSEFDYLDHIAETVISLTAAAKGRTLVLFTSHMHLREVYRRVEKPLMEKGINVLAHEISGTRSTILKKMREDSRTVILGANSFWEGIDIAGENLSLLIIVRLPFWPPDIPTIAAKSDLLKAENRNAFAELSLPQAIIRFKQGFGRLLRKENDRGIVCVLDKRIYEKRYGSDFVDSLPVPTLYHGTVEEISRLIEEKL